MKSLFIRGSIFILTVLLTGFLIFYFWAKSPNLNEEEYAGIRHYSHFEAPVQNDTLKVMTWNIGYLSGMTNNQAVVPQKKMHQEHMLEALQMIKDLGPDLIGFQEIDFYSRRSFFVNQMDSLALGAGYGYAALAVNWDDQYVPFPYWPPGVHFGRMLSGQAVLSRFPVDMNRRIILPKPPSNPFYYNAFYLDRLAQVVEVNLNGRVLVLINVHLEAFDRNARVEQAALLLESIDPYLDEYPVLLIGDFNSTPTYDVPGEENGSAWAILMSDSRLESAVSSEEYLEEPGRYYTFSSGEPEVMIDHILYNEQIRPVDVRVVHEAGTISDHLPLWFKFILKNN